MALGMDSQAAGGGLSHSSLPPRSQQHPGSPQISSIYCDTDKVPGDHQSGLSATELVPLAPGGTLPGTIYTSCWALPLGLNVPHARSACLVPHTPPMCWPALPTLLGKGESRTGMGASTAGLPPSPAQPNLPRDRSQHQPC